MPNGSAIEPFTRWNAKAIASRSNPRPECEVSSTGDFLSKAPSQSFAQGGLADEGGPDTTRPRWCAAGTGGVKDGTRRAPDLHVLKARGTGAALSRYSGRCHFVAIAMGVRGLSRVFEGTRF